MMSLLSSEVSATRHYDGYHLDVMLYYTKVCSVTPLTGAVLHTVTKGPGAHSAAS